MHTRILIPTLALAILSACSSQVEDTLPGQPIKHRQEAFKDILRVFEPMGTMLRTNSYDAERFESKAAALAERHERPWDYFVEGSFQPPTRARAEVWSRADAFEREVEHFLEATEALLLAARSREIHDIQSAYDTVYNSCRSCHGDFRDR